MAYAAEDHASLSKLETDAAERQKAVDGASACIDMYLRSAPRCNILVPVVLADAGDGWAALLETWTLTIAAWMLSKGSAGSSQKVRKDHALVMSKLKAIQDGKLCPDLPDDSSKPGRISVIGTKKIQASDELFAGADSMGWS